MPYVLVEDWRAGQDSRRPSISGPPGTLTKLSNAHITRGGDIEKRKALVPKFELPENTFGFTSTAAGLYVFGSVSTPVGMPVGVTYQRLQHPSGQAMTRVLQAELFNGLIYAIATFADGSTHHFYDGTRVTDWYDGRARGSFEVLSGTAAAAVAATGSFQVTAGSANVGTLATGSLTVTGGSSSPGVNRIVSITVNGIDILGTPVNWVTSNAATATAIATQINTYVSSPNYTAAAVGAAVTITATAAADSPPGGDPVLVTVGGTVTVGSVNNMTGGVAPNEFSAITVNGVNVLGAAIPWGGSNSATASAIAAQITSYTSTPNYTATALGDIVTITASTAGAIENGKTLAVATRGSVSYGSVTNMAGGVDGNAITSVTVNGIEIANTSVDWATSNSATASAIAAAINSYTSNPEYTAAANGAVVTVIATAAAADGPNGYIVATTVTGDVTIGNRSNMGGGVAGAGNFAPGGAVRTAGTKMYSASGSNWHGSKINDPTKWQTAETGAFRTNLSTHAAGSEELQAVEMYFSGMAIFAKNAVQIWSIDADPASNRQLQVLKSTGTSAPRSVVSRNDADVIYLADDGIKSLRQDAGSTITRAGVYDLGSLIDDDLLPWVAAQGEETVARAVGVIEPGDKRYWLAIGERVYVFSYFPGPKIAAWSTYSPGFAISDFAVFDKRLYARSGDTIYLYGGDDNATYDDCLVEVETPFFSMGKPASFKAMTGLDLAMDGLWTIDAGCEPNAPSERDRILIWQDQTMTQRRIDMQQASPFISLRMTHQKAEYARMSMLAIHFETLSDDAN